MESITLTAQGLRLRHLSDEAVVDRTLNGDPIAFGELYRRFRRRIEAFCAGRLSPAISAEDATQETFLRVLRASPQTVRNADAWLLTVARNACNDLMRKAHNPEELVGEPEDLPFDQLEAADTATELMRRQTARSVFLALRRMPVRYRTAIILREFHGLSSAEIAESMGTSLAAVDPLVSRARDAFGVAYAEVSGFPDACREAVELIYRDAGSGIDAAERSALDAHVAECPRCATEQRRAQNPRYHQALVPLIALAAPKWGALGQALQHAALAPGLLGQAATVPVALVTVAVGASIVAGSVGLSAASQDAYEHKRLSVPRAVAPAVVFSHEQRALGEAAAFDNLRQGAGQMAGDAAAGQNAAGGAPGDGERRGAGGGTVVSHEPMPSTGGEPPASTGSGTGSGSGAGGGTAGEAPAPGGQTDPGSGSGTGSGAGSDTGSGGGTPGGGSDAGGSGAGSTGGTGSGGGSGSGLIAPDSGQPVADPGGAAVPNNGAGSSPR